MPVKSSDNGWWAIGEGIDDLMIVDLAVQWFPHLTRNPSFPSLLARRSYTER